MPELQKRYIWVHGLLLLVSLVWGFNNIVMKLGFLHLSPQQFGAVRMLMVLPFMVYLAGFLPGRRPFERRDFWNIVMVAAVGMGLFQVLFPLGVHFTSAPVGGILMATMPVQVVIITMVFRIERPTAKAVTGVLLTVAGLVLITLSAGTNGGGGRTTPWGVFFLVTAEAGFAVHTTFLKKFMKRYSSLQVTGLAMSVAVMLYFIVFSREIFSIDVSSIPPQAFAAAAYSGIAALFLANVLWNISVKHIGSTKVAVYGNMPTVFVLIFSALIFNELLHPIQLAGAVVILAGVLMVQLRTKPKEAALELTHDPLLMDE